MSLYSDARDITKAALELSDGDRPDFLGAIPDPQTTTSGFGGFSAGGFERSSPDRNQIQLYRRLYRENPYINPGLDLRCGEVARPGFTVRTDDDELTDLLRKWADQCVIYGGEYDKPLGPQLWYDARAHDLDGTVLLEHMYDDPADPSHFSGFQSIDPLSVDILCYPESDRLIRPDDDPANVPEGTPKNARDEWACYIQNMGRASAKTESDVVPLSQRDVTKIVRNPMPDTPNHSAGSTGKAGQVRGMSIVEPVAEEAIAVQNRRDDYNAALKNIAHPRANVSFNQVQLPGGEILEWTTEQMQQFVNALRGRGSGASGTRGWKENRRESDGATDYSDLDGSGGGSHNSPGGIFGVPPGVETEWHTPELPDIEPSIRMSIDTIYGGLNVPKAYVGFGDNLNRDVTEPRVEQFDRDVNRIRRRISDGYTGIFQKKARFLIDRGIVSVADSERDDLVDSVEFAIESDQSKSPLKDEDFDAEAWYKYMQGWKLYIQSGVDAYLPLKTVVEQDLNMDYAELESALQDIEAADGETLAEIAGGGQAPESGGEGGEADA